MEKISEALLFEKHSKEEIKHWCQSLKYFHFMRARRGHHCEGDTFCTYFKYNGRDDLITKLDKIGVEVKQLEEGAIAFDPFGSYSIDDLDKIKYTITDFNDLEQPKDVELYGYKTHIWVQKESFEISLSGLGGDSGYDVSNVDFEACMNLEKEFDRLGWNKILDNDITSHSHCISKEKYPELFV